MFEKGKTYRVKTDHQFHSDKVGKVEFFGGPKFNLAILSDLNNPQNLFVVDVKDLVEPFKTICNVCVVLKNADFTEGRGPMLFHAVFSTPEKAREYVMSQDGIYGSKQGKSGYKTKDPNIEWYNGYHICLNVPLQE